MEGANGRADGSRCSPRDMMYHELPNDPDEVLYSGSEDELYENPRDRMRQYEIHAIRFLRGKKPFLLSTSLRGPFSSESGWRNPWRGTGGRIPHQRKTFTQMASETVGTEPARLSVASSASEAELDSEADNKQTPNDDIAEPPSPPNTSVDEIADTQQCDVHSSLFDPTAFHKVWRWRNDVRSKIVSKDTFWASSSDGDEAPTIMKRKAYSTWLRRDDIKRLRFEGTQSSKQSSPTRTPVHPRAVTPSAPSKVVVTEYVHGHQATSTPSSTKTEFNTLRQIHDARIASKPWPPWRRAEVPQPSVTNAAGEPTRRKAPLESRELVQSTPKHDVSLKSALRRGHSATGDGDGASSTRRSAPGSGDIHQKAIYTNAPRMAASTADFVQAAVIREGDATAERQSFKVIMDVPDALPDEDVTDAHFASQHDDSFHYRARVGAHRTEAAPAVPLSTKMPESRDEEMLDLPEEELPEQVDTTPETQAEAILDQPPEQLVEEKSMEPLQQPAESLEDPPKSLEDPAEPLEVQPVQVNEGNPVELLRGLLEGRPGLPLEQTSEKLLEESHEEQPILPSKEQPAERLKVGLEEPPVNHGGPLERPPETLVDEPHEEPPKQAFEDLLENLSHAAFDELLAFQEELVQESPKTSTDQLSNSSHAPSGRTTDSTLSMILEPTLKESTPVPVAITPQPATYRGRESHWDIVINQSRSKASQRATQQRDPADGEIVLDNRRTKEPSVDPSSSLDSCAATVLAMADLLSLRPPAESRGTMNKPETNAAGDGFQCAKPRVPFQDACVNARCGRLPPALHPNVKGLVEDKCVSSVDSVVPVAPDAELEGLAQDAVSALQSHRVELLLAGIQTHSEKPHGWRRRVDMPRAAMVEDDRDMDDDFNETTLVSSQKDIPQRLADLKSQNLNSQDADVTVAESRISAGLNECGVVGSQLHQLLDDTPFTKEPSIAASSPLSSAPSSLVDPYEDTDSRLETQDQSPWATVDDAAILFPAVVSHLDTAFSAGDEDAMDMNLTPTRPRPTKEQSPFVSTDMAGAVPPPYNIASPDSASSYGGYLSLPTQLSRNRPTVLTCNGNKLSQASNTPRPSTPETKQSSLPTPESTLSIKSFKRFILQSPEKLRQPSTLNGLKSALSDPSARASRNTLKSMRRVRFKFERQLSSSDGTNSVKSSLDDSDDEDYIEAGLPQHRGRRSARNQQKAELRSASPPPEISLTDQLLDADDDAKKSFKRYFSVMAKRLRLNEAKPRVQEPRVKESLIPSASQEDLRSPRVDAMAERFMEVDRQSRRNDGLRHLDVKVVEEAAQSLDEVDDVLLNLGAYLNPFDVEDDLRQANLEAKQDSRSVQQLGEALEINVWS